ncbi:MAG: MotA/TolQ/ExbB proton channel family protein [Planctomycetes bacterium]|nr:MotA/TolQ/ExbB proton channel family protein [Planctomycetota bacterium]
MALVATGGLFGGAGAAWDQAVAIWIAGGWAMVGIALDAVLMFGIGVHMLIGFVGKRIGRVPEKVWRLWIEHPSHREGPIGALLDKVTGVATIADSVAMFEGLRRAEIAPFERNLRVMRVCVAVGPLLGLFGTVTGMLVTFGALAGGSGGDKTMAAIAKGISEALITTETGLVVALPGLLFHYQLARAKDRYTAFFARLESVCTQHLYRKLHRQAAA